MGLWDFIGKSRGLGPGFAHVGAMGTFGAASVLDTGLAGSDLSTAGYGSPPVSHWPEEQTDSAATALMDHFRRTGSQESFGELFRLTASVLMRRVRRRARFAGDRLDPHELLQDTFVNIFRYPDKFDPSRPAAFRAWATTIVDNTVRRHLRRARTGVEMVLQPVEVLSQEADGHARAPETNAIDCESQALIADAYLVFLTAYLNAYQQLSERERFALQMVEVKGLRYVEVGELLAIRPEAVKMVVFRARRRVFERMTKLLTSAGA
jgi:RNA polymerase sigma factor (sigma-70 family)